MRDSNESTPPLKNDGRGLFRPALRTNDTERFEQNVQGGRLVRGLVGVMTFAPTLSFLGNLFVSLTALGTGILATGAILGEESEAQCTTWGAFTVTGTCTGTQTGTVDHVSGNQTFNRDLNLSSNFTINNSSSGSNDHGFIVGKSGTGGTSQGGHITITQLGTASDSFTISAAGRAVWLKANITNTSVGTTTLTLIRGIQSRKNVGAFVDGYGGHVSATFRTVSGKTGGIHARHRASTAGQNMTITATRSVTTESGPGVYAKKDTSGNLTLSLSAVTGGSATTSTSSIGVHLIHTGSSGSATVTVTGTTQAGKYGLKANLTSNGNHNIKMATITSSGHGAHISGTRQLTFSSTGNITASAGHGFYLNRGDGTSTGNLRLNFRDVSATQDGIHIYSNTASATTITTNGNVKSTSSGFNGIYVNNLGSGNITLTISGGYQKVIQGGGKRNASPGPPSVSEKLGYALNVNSVTSGSAASGTGTVTITITGGVTVSGTTSAGAILNGDGNSSILFRGFYTNLNGNVKLGKGEDKLVFSSGIKIAANVELDGGQEAANSTLTDEVTFDRAYSILSNVRGISINVLTVDPNNLKNWERVNLKQSTVWRVTGTKTLTTKNFYLGGILTLEEATNARPDDSLTIAGNLVGEGNQSQIQLNVNFDVGTADTLTVTGNVTGVIPINVVNVSPSGSASNIPNDISIVTVQGTTASTAFSVHRLSQHLPINANLVFNSTTKTFYFEAVHVPLCVTPTGGSSGTFVCSGTLDFPEVMIATGTTSIVATLNSASTTVSSSEAGFLFTLRGKNGITFTQSTGGGTLTADGSATGVIDVLNSGNGNVEVTLVGSASLAGSGTAVKVASTGTGTVTVSANNITASHSQAKAVQLEGAGTRVLLDAKGTVAGGIETKNTHSTGTATVSASATVTNGTGTAIYAYGKGNLVEVKTSSTVTGSATGSNAVGGIKVVNKSSGSGAIKISVGGTLTSSGGIGIHAENDGTGALTITAAAVSASNSTPINVVNRNSGDIILNISGQVTGSSSTSAGEGIKIADSGSGDIEINTASVTGGAHGILVEKNNAGSVEITISGDVTGRGTSNREYGISVKPNASAGNITLNLSNHKVTGGYAINIYGKPSAETTITSSGEIEGKGGGIYFYSDQSATLNFDLHTVTASSVRGISIQAYGGVSASIDVASGGKIEAKTYGIVVNSDGTGSIEIDASGAITAEDSVGLWIDHAGNGAVTLSTVSVTGGKQGILIQKEGTGNVTLTSTGTIESDSDLDGVHATVTGAGNVSLTVSAVTGDKMGVFAKNVGAGTVTVNANGAITATGTGTKDAGIYAITNTSGDKIEINVNSSGSVSGKFGIYTESESSSNIEITTSGAVTGTGEDGISAKLTSGTLTIKISGNVTGASSKVGIETQTNASGNSIITIYSGTVTSSGGNAITNNGGSSTVTIHSVARVTAGISLGAGVDVLTFSGGVISPDYTIDGGEDSGTDTSTDELSINSISALLNASKLTNWEVISFGTGTTGRFDGTVNLATDEFRVPNGATLSLKDEATGDTLTVGGDFSGGGTIELDVNLATGAKDSIVVQGDVSGVTKIKINDKTPSNASGLQETIQIVSLTGTSTSNAISLDGSLRSLGYSYSIELDTTGKIFNLVGTRTNLLCVEDTNTEGSFACSGTINVSESMIETGTTNIVTSLANDTTVSVSAFIALYMLGQNAITFTQAANGGAINGIGNATGAVKAKTTGNGNVHLTLTGTATLAGSGTVVAAESTGTGNISVTTQKVTASNSSARGIFADGRAAITINANDEVTGGIEIITRANGGKVTVNASSTVSSDNNDGIHVKRQAGGGGSSASIEIIATGAVTGSRHGIYVKGTGSGTSAVLVSATGAISATAGTGIHAYGKGVSVTVTASTTVTGSASSGAVGGIKAVNKSAGAGTVSVNAGGKITTTGGSGIHVENEGTGGITISATEIESSGSGVVADNSNSGALILNLTGTITTATGSGGDGVRASSHGADDIEVNTVSVTGDADGIYLNKTGGGSITLTIYGAIESRGDNNDQAAIAAINDSEGDDIEITLSNHAITGGYHGLYVYNEGDGNITITSTGEIAGNGKHGIYVNQEGSSVDLSVHTVRGEEYGIYLKHYGDSTAEVTVASGGSIVGGETGINVYAKSDSDITIEASGTIRGRNSDGLYVYHSGDGNVTLSVASVSGKSDGIDLRKYGSGNATLTATGKVETANNSEQDGLEALSSGAGNISISVGAVTGEADGIDVRNYLGGTIELNVTGAIVSNGTGSSDTGIYAYADEDAGNISLSVGSAGSVTGRFGVTASSKSSGNITINTSGSITGTAESGILGEITNGELSITVSGDVTGSSSKVAINTKSDASGTTTIVINNGIITASGGTAIQNDGGASDITINSGATINEKISLGGGVDKLAFIGKAPGSNLELDGGNDTGTDTSVDVLTFSGFTASVSAAQLKNWENVVVVAGTTINFVGTQNLVAKTLTLSGGVVSLSDNSVGDSLTITGSVSSSGSLGIDVNLSTGSADTITVTGDLTGTHKLIVNDITRTNEIARVSSVKVVSVEGTTSSQSLTLQNRFKSGGFAYSLEYNAGQNAFYLIGIRSTINCLESEVNPGNYTCSGNFALTENILGDGTGNLVVVLDASAVVNVGASVAMSMEGAGSITFTQDPGGGSINAAGSATGVIHAKTSGSGAINITLTGTANLVSQGTAILVDSTGTGSITVTTSRVTANDSGATAISLMGSGDSIQLNTQSAVSGGKAGIIVKNVNSTGTVSISAGADIASSSGTAIYAYGKGASVTVSASGQASGNALGIKAVNKSTGSGSLTITAGNSVKGTLNTGIYASNSGAGGLAVTAGVVTGGKAGIDARNYTSGNLTINVTGTVSVTGTANDDGINSYNKGSGNITVSTVAVTGAASGVDIRNYGGGAITASFNGAVIATGTSTGDAGVVLINDAQGSDVTATVIAGSSVIGQHGIRGEHHGSGAFLVNAIGTISGRTEDGINIKGGTAGSITLNVNEVSAAKRAFHITNTGAGSVAITATGTVKTNATLTAVTAISVINSGSTTLTLSTVQATRTGVYVSSTGQGSSTITLNGAVSAAGNSAEHGVYAKAGDRAGNIVINVPAGGGVTGRNTAIKAVSSGSGSLSIVTSANLAASNGGVHAQVVERGNISLNITGDITLSGSETVAIDTSSRSGTTTIIIGGGTIGGKTSIKNNEGDSTVTVNKGVELDGNIELGGGVDKLTFNDSFNADITIDGGKDSGIDRSKDVLAMETGSANIDISKIKNWEILQVGAASTVTINETSTLTFEQVMLAGTLSLKNDSAGDALTLSGDLAPHGTNNTGVLEVDVDFSTGDSDTISISGNISGSHNLTIVDVTPSDKTDRFLTRINVVTVGGNATASNLSLTGTRFASGGYLYKINFDNQTRTFYLTGERGTLNCGSSSEGVYSCSGSIIFPENMRTIGDTAVVATLGTGATVNVTASIAIQMTSENSISFTQATGGQPINASGAAYGVVLASNTGRGNVSVTLTGTANLEGAGTAVTARSTGTGNVSVTTASVVADHSSATAIRANGRGEQVSVNATAVSAGRNGIIATNRSNGGATSVVTTGTVTSSGTGIYAFSLSGNVNINATSVSGGVSAIVAKNDGGTGNVSVTAGGLVTASGSAIQAYNYGTGTLNVRGTNSVIGLSSDGINVIAGADTTSITVSAMNTTGRRNAIRVENKGTATANVNVSGNTIGNRGSAIHVENDGSGSINIIASSRITGGNQGTGIETRTKGGATKITLNAGATVSGASGIAIRNDEGSSDVTVNAGASVSGTVLLGGGVDRLTFANATFGNSILDGGSDSGADVSVDVLTINAGSFALSEESFVNWENIVFGPQTNITVDGVAGLNTNSLTVQGTLSMQDGVTNDSFTIDGNLVGGGTIKIDADFFTGNHDELIVSGNVTGRTTIEVSDISPSTGGRDQESMEIITVTGSSTTISFSLLNGGFTSGAYQYELEFLPATKTYALSKKQSVGSVMLVAAPITLLDGFAKLPSLHERRSIDSTQSNWTRVIGNTNSYGKAAAGQAEYESQTTGLQAGFDFAKLTTPTGTWVYGVTAQFNSMDTDIEIATTEGELMAEGYGVGATATWIGLNGAYLDIQAQYNQMTIDFLVAGSGTTFIDGQDSKAMAISMELGKRHVIGENLTFLTNGQVSWGLADIGDVKSSSGQPIVFGDDANITARFGMRLEYDEEPYKLHVLGNVYYDTLESWKATFANATYTDSKDPVSLELGLGGSMKLSPNSNLFMQGGFRKTTDDEYEQRDSAHFTTGVRWSW